MNQPAHLLAQDYNPVAAYPMLMLLLRLRLPLLILGTLSPLTLAVMGGVFDRGAAWVVLALAASAATFVVLKAMLELLALVTDLLIPR